MILAEFVKNAILIVISVLVPQLAAPRAQEVFISKIMLAPICALLIIMGFYLAILAKVTARITSSNI